MKKEWLNAEMEALEIKETAGGKILTGKPDGEWVYDDQTEKWWEPGGTDTVLSE